MTYKVYDSGFRGKCPTETAEQITFFARLRREYPDTWGALAVHIRNEGKRHQNQVQREKAEGMTTGASDILIPGAPAFVCELKRKDRTKCRLSAEQKTYLEAAQKAGAFTCVAYGCDEAWRAFQDWTKYLD